MHTKTAVGNKCEKEKTNGDPGGKFLKDGNN